MDSLSTATESSSFHALISNVSCLFGVVVFLQQMWGRASIEHTLLTTAGAGLAAYLILAVGYVAARTVVTHEPPDAEMTGDDPTGDDEAPGSGPDDEAPAAQEAAADEEAR